MRTLIISGAILGLVAAYGAYRVTEYNAQFESGMAAGMRVQASITAQDRQEAAIRAASRPAPTQAPAYGSEAERDLAAALIAERLYRDDSARR